MAKGNPPKTIHCFAAGTHTSMGGQTLTFGEDDIRATIDAYDPDLHEAPLVVGHPQHDAPAYGWVRKLSGEGGNLEAEPHQVNPDFAEMLGAGAFKKVSASFYPPTSPNNPVPGVYYLRHVGFLGAQPPAIKGLRQFEFGDGDEVVTIEFGEWEDEIEVGIFRRLREWLIEQFSGEVADKIVPTWELDQLQRDALKPDALKPEEGGASSSYSETDLPKEDDVDEKEKKELADLRAQKKKMEEQEAAFAEKQRDLDRKARRDDATAFVEKLVADGCRVLPADQAGLVAFMTADAPTDVIEFGEGDEKFKDTGEAWFKGFIRRLPRQVEFGEVSAQGDEGGEGAGYIPPTGFSVDPEKARIHRQALAYAEQHGVDYLVAVQKVGGR
ncbi:MAG: hypothetical protein AUJ55_10145 [Proteobacteria bacterium CG1_02_64_396]|nr:MAG: hypothetical protein AUJ55_10145 [Proteobacteria bacterium CG1_02_64_396]